MKLRIVVPENRTRRIARLLLLITGIVCLGIFSYSYLYRTAYQIYEGWQFDHDTDQVSAHEPEPSALPVVLPDPDRPTRASKASLSRGVIGRISIPRLHLSSIVEEGVDDLTLSRSVGHIPGTAFPGELGNVGIAGHRDTFFRALKDIQRHDKIVFQTHSGRYNYIVESLTVVEPSDVSVLKPKGGHALTIVTCFPFHYIGNAPRRFIVHAVSDP